MFQSTILMASCLAAVSCANVSSLGISADIDENHPGANLTTTTTHSTLATSAALEPRKRSVISARDNETMTLQRAAVGDIDGDGMDDFVVRAYNETGDVIEQLEYLFYGRTDFPAELTLADADASYAGVVQPLGDINCDGLADLSYGGSEGLQIVFGDRTRVSGPSAAFPENGFTLRGTASEEEQSVTYLEGLRPIGDIDADGCDDLIVRVGRNDPDIDWEMYPGGLVTDYIFKGRSEDWPAGLWQDSWAAAQLGDEPPAYVDDGARTIVQRLAVMGSGDLDGDGFTDLLALGLWRVHVFYGSAAGFSGTLTPAQAAASISWGFKAEDRIDFARTLPIVIADVDGDGTAELGLPDNNALGVVYGSSARLRGRVRLEPDLTIVRSKGQLLENSVSTVWQSLDQNFLLGVPGPLPVSATVRVVTTDLDGDGQRELVLQEDLNPWPATPENVIRHALYALTGPSKHTTGRYVLSDADLYKLDDAAEVLSTAVLLDPGGDFDGDGSADLLFGLTTGQATAGFENSLHLLAGVPHAPD